MSEFNAPVEILSNVNKSISDNTAQIATAFSMIKSGLKIAIPTYPKEKLLEACKNSAVNARCIAVKAACIAGIGYTFENQDNAESSGVTNFINNLIDRNGNPISFSKLLTNWFIDHEYFGESYLEIARYNNELRNLLLLSAKNCYTDLDRTFIAQIIMSGDKVNKYTMFRPYGEYTSTERDVLTLCKQSAFDDVYGVPNYTACLTTIEANNKINAVNIDAMTNTISGSYLFTVAGEVTPEQFTLVVEALRKLKSQKGSSQVVQIPGTNASLTIQTIGNTTVDGSYIQQREKNELEIMSIHGVTPELYGMMQAGGISSGEKATGALKIFLQTVVRPEQETLSKQMDAFFIQEFPTYQGGFKLKEIDLTDSLQDQQSEQIKAAIQQSYITMGSLKLFNEYRVSVNLSEVTKQEFAVMVGANIPSFGQPSPGF